MTPLPTIDRECGGCTACCTVIGVSELKKNNWQPCDHCTEGKGCNIYQERPQSCSNFRCFWLAGLIDGDERRRPDKLGIIFSHGDTKQAGPVILAWEVWPGAAQSHAARYVLEKLGKKHKVLTMTRTGCQPNVILNREILKQQFIPNIG